MGAIPEYQRRQLASSVVGITEADKSGQIIAEGVGNLANAMIRRRQALDKIQYTNAFYDFTARDEVRRVELQKEFGAEPERFPEAYFAESVKLADEVKAGLPDRQKGRFDQLLNRRRAQILPANQTWVFNQQNAIGLMRVKEMGAQAAVSATTWTDAKGYLDGIAEYEKTFDEVARPLINPASAQNELQATIKTATLMYLAAMQDLNNGSAIQLRDDLEGTSPEQKKFQEKLVQVLGAREFQTQKNRAEKQVKNLMSEQTYRYVRSRLDDPEVRNTLSKISADTTGVSLSEQTARVMAKEIALTEFKRSRRAAENPEQLALLEEEVRQAKALEEIARSRNAQTVPDDPSTVARLHVLIADAVTGVRTPSEVEDLRAAVREEKSNQRWAVGVMSKKSKAPKNHSELMQTLYQVQGDILESVRAGKLNAKTGEKMIDSFVLPLSSLNEYDRVTSGDGWFVKAWDSFSNYASNISASREEQVRIRGRMMSEYMARVRDANNMSPRGVSDRALAGIAKMVRMETARAILPAKYHGIKEKDTVIVGGKPRVFRAIDPETGEMVYEADENLLKSLRNI